MYLPLKSLNKKLWPSAVLLGMYVSNDFRNVDGFRVAVRVYGYIGIMEKKMETTIMGLHRV